MSAQTARRSCVTIGVFFWCAGLAFPISALADSPVMRAHFIDVGQGDATLLEFACAAVLVDTGGADEAHVVSLVEYLSEFFERRPDLDSTLSAVFITHPHLDHTRGLREVANSFRVVNYIDSRATARFST